MSAADDRPRPLPPLPDDAHKGTAGRAACVAGSRAMPGAAVLVARAAQRAGAGLVSMVCLDPSLLTVLPVTAPEAVLVEAYDAHLLEHSGDLGALLDPRGAHARLLGPGVGDDDRARFLVRGLLASDFDGPLALDADGLNALDGEPERLRDAHGPVVITPHPGEAARLLGRSVPKDDEGRAAAARELAERSGAVVCLKGHRTVVADGERLAVNATGNPGMATAGAGDVLSGALVGLLARARAGGDPRPDAFAVARLAVHVHGRAGDLAAERGGRSGLVASDLVARLPEALRELEGALNALAIGLLLAGELALAASGAGAAAAQGNAEQASDAQAATARGTAAPGADAAVEREWTLRRRAFDLAAAGAELARALATERPWSERRAALEALRRGLVVGPARATDDAEVRGRARGLALVAVDDPHPNVRAAALRALAATGPGAGAALAPPRVAALAADRLPVVRRALARALEGVASDAALAALARLARDPDPRVAEAAGAALFTLGAGLAPDRTAAVAAVQADALAAYASGGDDEARLAAFRLLARAGPAPGALARFRARSRAARPEAGRGERAVAAALALAWNVEDGAGVAPGETPNAARSAGQDDARGDAAAARRRELLDGWLADATWRPRRQELLVRAGDAGPAAELGAALLHALERVERIERGDAPPPDPEYERFDADVRARAGHGPGAERLGGERAAELFHLRYDLFEALLRHDGPDGLAARLAARAPDPAAVAFLLPELGSAAPAWDAARDARWLAPERPRDVRVAAAEAFASTLSATGGPGARALCARALADPDPIVVRIAYRALCSAERPPLQALFAATRRAEAEERLRMMAWLPREESLVPFRAMLLEGATTPGPARPLSIELLGTLTGDRGVAAVLGEELERALAALRDAAADGDAEGLRAAELDAVGLVRALARVGGPGVAGRLDAAVAAAVGRSEQLGKVAAALLAGAPARLAAYLGDEVDRRIRVEAAIQIARKGVDPAARRAAAARLIADLDATAWSLRVRIVDALGALAPEVPAATRRLVEIALDVARPPEDRKRALEALAAAGELAPVRAAAASGRDVDVRLIALRLLAAAGDDLTPYRAALPAERLLDADRRRLSLLVLRVGAARGSLTAEQAEALVAGPLAEAAATQRARFAGPAPSAPRPPDPTFAWGDELAALAALARHGRFGRVVDADALARLDGRLLLALAEHLLDAGALEPGRDVLRAAWIALQADVDAPASLADGALARLFALAWGTERFGEAARLADELLRRRRTRRVADSLWAGVFGVADPARGVDPEARLAAAAAQARARAALAAGEVERARAFAAEAAGLVGASAAAAEEQARLERALER